MHRAVVDFTIEGRPHRFFPIARSWAGAQKFCAAIPGGSWRLVSFQSLEQEQQAFARLPKVCNGFWIGLRKTDGGKGWVWDDGAAVGYFSWGPGQPNNFGGNQTYVAARHVGCVAGSSW